MIHKRKNLLKSQFLSEYLLFSHQFVKVKHYGISSNGTRDTQLLTALMNEAEERASWEEMLIRITGIDPAACPHCGKAKGILRELLLSQHIGSPPARRRIISSRVCENLKSIATEEIQNCIPPPNNCAFNQIVVECFLL